jgi:phosphate transport system substrate-binding protein
MGTFAVVPKISDNAEQTQRALRFFVWAFTHGDLLVQKQNFVRLPDRVQAAAFRAISSIKDKAGKNIGMSL